MIALEGIIRNGQVVLPDPVAWPDGTKVTVLPREPTQALGIADEEWPTDPEAIAQLIARMERVEPLDLTVEEEADTEAWRQKIKEHTLANQSKALEGLFE